jgi:MFS family permease
LAQVFYGWKLLSAFWVIAVINLAFPAYGSAVLNAAMAAELGFDRQALGTMVAVYLAMSGLPGPLVAASVNRIGVRWTLVIGSGFVIAGSVMLATIVDSVALAIVAFGLIVGVGVATGAIIAAQAGVARWVVRRRSLALSLLYSAGGIGGFLAPQVLGAIATTGPGAWPVGPPARRLQRCAGAVGSSHTARSVALRPGGDPLMATLAPRSEEPSRAVSLTLRAGLLTAIADAFFGIVQYRLAGVPSPVTRFFQGIASVPFGKRPDNGGAWAVALGVLLHLAVACFWAGLFALLLARSSRRARLLVTPGGTLLVATAYGPHPRRASHRPCQPWRRGTMRRARPSLL